MTSINLTTCFYVNHEALSALAIVFVSAIRKILATRKPGRIVSCVGHSRPKEPRMFGVSSCSLFRMSFESKQIANHLHCPKVQLVPIENLCISNSSLSHNTQGLAQFLQYLQTKH